MGRLALAGAALAALCAQAAAGTATAAQAKAGVEGTMKAALRSKIVDAIGESDRPITSRFEARRRAREAADSAEAVLRSDAADLRAAGLSGSKVASLVDLAEHAADGRLALEHMGRMRDQEVIDHLVHVRGIGPWSAQMFLMHSMWRLDVWPVGDFGVRAGFARAWSLGAQPSPAQLEVLGAPFAPYRSVVAWYCWRCADDPAG